MDLEWVVLCCVVVEGLMLILITLPGPEAFKKGLAFVTTNLLKIFFSVCCLLLLMEIYSEDDETMPTCESHSCSSEHLRHETSIMKSQRDALLIATVLVLYWILYFTTKLVVRVDQLKQRTEKLKNQVQE